jgi:hypothetical protein
MPKFLGTFAADTPPTALRGQPAQDAIADLEAIDYRSNGDDSASALVGRGLW